jgi:hypothetical protein
MDREGWSRLVERDKYYILAAAGIEGDIEISLKY